MPRQKTSDDILLFIMRHGEAEAASLDDKSRTLTKRGQKEASTTSQWLKNYYCSDAKIDLALVSPYQRARQSYDVVLKDISIEKTKISSDFTPESNPQLAHDYINAMLTSSSTETLPVKRVLVVSHMPLVSYLLDDITEEKSHSLFATAGLAVVKYVVSQHRGELITLYQGK